MWKRIQISIRSIRITRTKTRATRRIQRRRIRQYEEEEYGEEKYEKESEEESEEEEVSTVVRKRLEKIAPDKIDFPYKIIFSQVLFSHFPG